MRDTREAAMRRHPAGKGRIEQLIAEAQDWQAMDVGNRARAELEGWAGGPIPESAEVRWERETAQAMSVANRVDEWHHEVSTGPRRVWVDVVAPFVGVLGLVLLVCAASFFGDVSGGWPA